MSGQVDDQPQGRPWRAGRTPVVVTPTTVVAGATRAAAAVVVVAAVVGAVVAAAMGLGAAMTVVVTVVASGAGMVGAVVVEAAAVKRRTGASTKESGRESVRDSKLRNQPPPLSAEKLLLFALPPRISDPIIGDLAERFPSVQERHGDWFARAWYWRHAVGAVTRFIGPRLAGATSLGAVLRVARRLLSR